MTRSVFTFLGIIYFVATNFANESVLHRETRGTVKELRCC